MNLNSLPRRWPLILDIDEQNEVKNRLYSNDVNWFIASATISKDFVPEYEFDPRVMDTFNCVHRIYGEYPNRPSRIETPFISLYNASMKIIDTVAKDLNLKVTAVPRIKANTIFQENEFKPEFFNIPHKDYEEDNIMSIVYYVDTVDGDTVVFDKYDGKQLGEPLRFKPIQGSAIVFKSNVLHSSSNPIRHRRRTIINITFQYEELNGE